MAIKVSIPKFTEISRAGAATKLSYRHNRHVGRHCELATVRMRRKKAPGDLLLATSSVMSVAALSLPRETPCYESLVLIIGINRW